MGRTRQRFSRLFDKLKSTKGTPEPGSDAANFLLFLNGTNNITQTNKPPKDSKKRFRTSVLPFSITPPGTLTAANRYRVMVSAYAINGRTSRLNAVSAADLGWADEETGTSKNPLFYPAVMRVVVSRANATLNPTKRSAVTQKNYGYLPKRSFSLPFGRTAGAPAEDEYTRKSTLLAAATGADALQVTFVPEEFQLESGGQGIADAPVIALT